MRNYYLDKGHRLSSSKNHKPVKKFVLPVKTWAKMEEIGNQAKEQLC